MPSNSPEKLGDSVAWGGCTIIYLLGQQLHFELFDFSYQILNIAEVEAASVVHTHKNSHVPVQVCIVSYYQSQNNLVLVSHDLLSIILTKLVHSLLLILCQTDIIEMFSSSFNFFFLP